MSNTVSIEKVTTTTFSIFLELIKQLANYEHVEPPDTQAQQRLQKDCLGTHTLFDAYLAYKEETAIGYLIVYYTYSSFLALPTLFIEDIYVKEEHRQQGYGQYLFDFCKQLANKRGCGRMEWNVYTWNAPALDFYEKNHAQRLDKYYYRLDKDQFA